MSRTKKDTAPKDQTASMAAAFEQAAGAAGLACEPGKSAVNKRYRTLIDAKQAKTQFTGSVDLDAAFNKAEPNAHRWDFGLGMQLPGRQECALWVEPHSAASTGEVKTMLAKVQWLKSKLSQPAFKGLKALTDECVNQGIAPYHWLATAHVTMRAGSREAYELARHGLRMPSSKVVIG